MSTTAFPVNPQLTAIAMAYRNPAVSLIADDVLPTCACCATTRCVSAANKA